jgi:hypothetical protein
VLGCSTPFAICYLLFGGELLASRRGVALGRSDKENGSSDKKEAARPNGR